jgi:hypothetical protein
VFNNSFFNINILVNLVDRYFVPFSVVIKLYLSCIYFTLHVSYVYFPTRVYRFPSHFLFDCINSITDSYSCWVFLFQWLFQPIQGHGLLFSSVIIISQTVGLLGRVISPSQGLYLNTGEHKHRINSYTHQTSIPWMWFEPTIPPSQRVKTVHVLYRAATVTGTAIELARKNKELNRHYYYYYYWCHDLGVWL